MTRKIKILSFALLIASLLFSAGQDRLTEPKKSLISMDIHDYRSYLETNPPLDRLFRSGDACFFLVDSRERSRLEQAALPFQAHALPAKTQEGGANGLYHSYQESADALFDLAARFPDLARVSSIGQSIEGRELWLIKISDNVSLDEAEPNIFIVGCHHAREWISVEVPLLFAQYVLENYPANPQVRSVLEDAQLYILPVLNPDGLEFSIHRYRWWRKNRRYNGDFAWGVDINRNYGFQWGRDNNGSSPNPFSEAYRGPVPFSEPETSAAQNFLLNHPPAATLSYHNYAQMILYPWGYTEELAPDDAEMREIAAQMSARIFQVNGRFYEYGPGAATIYPTNGDLDDWVYATFAVPAFTIELPPLDFFSGAFFTAQEEIARSFAENLPAMLYFVDYFVSKWQGNLDQTHTRVDKTIPMPDYNR